MLQRFIFKNQQNTYYNPILILHPNQVHGEKDFDASANSLSKPELLW